MFKPGFTVQSTASRVALLAGYYVHVKRVSKGEARISFVICYVQYGFACLTGTVLDLKDTNSNQSAKCSQSCHRDPLGKETISEQVVTVGRADAGLQAPLMSSQKPGLVRLPSDGFTSVYPSRA